MLFSERNYMAVGLNEYKIVASKIPTESEPAPAIYTSNIFAKNSVVARSLFAKLMSKQYKIKQSSMVVFNCELVKQDDDYEVKNYRIDFVYRTKTGKQNAYKEVRHVNKCCAINTLFQEFGSRHKLRGSDISIISIKQIDASEATKMKCLTYSAEDVKFPVFKKIPNVEKQFVPVSQNIFN